MTSFFNKNYSKILNDLKVEKLKKTFRLMDKILWR